MPESGQTRANRAGDCADCMWTCDTYTGGGGSRTLGPMCAAGPRVIYLEEQTERFSWSEMRTQKSPGTGASGLHLFLL
jgi:hypothetical protein